MKKLALATALAAGIAFVPAASTPARADGGTTAAIIAGVIVGGAIINTAACGQLVCYWRPVAAPAPWPFWWWGPQVTVKSKKKK
jgi:hypothetical protein